MHETPRRLRRLAMPSRDTPEPNLTGEGFPFRDGTGRRVSSRAAGASLRPVHRGLDGGRARGPGNLPAPAWTREGRVPPVLLGRVHPAARDARAPGRRAAYHKGGRPVVFVSNHSSWVDVPVLGGKLDTCFISKEDVARWPLVSIGRNWAGRSSSAASAWQHRARARCHPGAAGSRGQSGALPRRDHLRRLARAAVPLLVLRRGRGREPAADPARSVVYDRLGGLPTGRANRPLFAGYGDMDIASHFWRLTSIAGCA